MASDPKTDALPAAPSDVASEPKANGPIAVPSNVASKSKTDGPLSAHSDIPSRSKTDVPIAALHNMASESKTDASLPTCTKLDCPLVQAGIPHSEGIYLHEGKDAGFSITFAKSNPPPFVWEANNLFWEGETAIRAVKGVNNKELEETTEKHRLTLKGFLNYHGGCNCKEHGHAH